MKKMISLKQSFVVSPFAMVGCYAKALGYSKCRIEELKSDIRSRNIVSDIFDVQCNGRSSVVHENTVHIPWIVLGMQAMESVFEKYVQEFGCTQPHRECQQRNDNEMVPLVSLLVNTRQEDVLQMYRRLQWAKHQAFARSTVCGACTTLIFKSLSIPGSQNAKFVGNIERALKLVILIQHKNKWYGNN